MYEKPEFLKPMYYLGVAFKEGPIFFKITGREIVRYEPYEVGTISAGGTKKDIEPKDDRDNRILEPEQERFIVHAFVGVEPEVAEVYLDFPPRVSRFNLYGKRSVPGNVKWIDGVTSPFDNPNGISELIAFKDLYPSFSIYNAGDEDIYAMLSFEIAKYTYRVIDDTDTIRALIEGKKRSKIYTFLEPYQAPGWLIKLVGSDLMTYAADVWNSILGKNPNI